PSPLSLPRGCERGETEMDRACSGRGGALAHHTSLYERAAAVGSGRRAPASEHEHARDAAEVALLILVNPEPSTSRAIFRHATVAICAISTNRRFRGKPAQIPTGALP